VVGVIGGGQLARMLTQAAVPLPCRIRVLAAPGATEPPVGDTVYGDCRDPATVTAFARGCDVVTFDHELVPPPVLDTLASLATEVHPSPGAMGQASDKVAQRSLAGFTPLEVAPYEVIDDIGGLIRATARFGFPIVAKAARGGYDGRGVTWIDSPDYLTAFAIGALHGGAVLIEPALRIDAELAVTIARRPGGDHVVYPVVRTYQSDGICRSVAAPAATTPDIARTLEEAAVAIAERLGLVGVLTVEAFLIDHRLYLNELAPRPHNSAHYTIDACTTSQFENHLRAILDLPLGDPTMTVPAAAMANIIAATHDNPDPTLVDLPPATSVHLYGKQARPGRKIGHVTVTGTDRTAVLATAQHVADQHVNQDGDWQPVSEPTGTTATLVRCSA
jgi:5-(carboxyamino)imidazole ribonucleotide synthase